MEEPGLDEDRAELLRSLNEGQLFISAEAVRQRGSELRVGRRTIADAVASPSMGMQVDTTDGPLVLRLVEQPENSVRNPS